MKDKLHSIEQVWQKFVAKKKGHYTSSTLKYINSAMMPITLTFDLCNMHPLLGRSPFCKLQEKGSRTGTNINVFNPYFCSSFVAIKLENSRVLKPPKMLWLQSV
jgi:hypothetical protein